MPQPPDNRQPVRIPLSFSDAIGGLLAVDPKKLPPRKRTTAKKKPARKPTKKKG